MSWDLKPPSKSEMQLVNTAPAVGDSWDSLPPPPEISKTESAARGAAQGASFGFADEASGFLEALWNKAKGNPTEFGNLYQKYRDESRENFKAAKKANPGSYTTGEIGGAIGTAFIPGMGQANTVKALASTGAKIGGLSAMGNSEADSLEDLAVDTGIGAVTGAVGGAAVGKVAQVASPVVQKVSDKAKAAAEWLAARSLGLERGTMKSLGADRVREASRQALDKGVISPLASTEDKIARNTALKERGGKIMDHIYDVIDDAKASTFNPLEVAAKVDEKLGGFYRSPINRGETNQLENTLESILMRGDKNIPLKEAQALKEEIGKVANWKNKLNPTDKEKMAREAYGIVSGEIDRAVENGAKVVEANGLKETLGQGKKLYSNAKTTDVLLENKAARESGNQIFGLTDAITGAGAIGYGGATGDWQTAGGLFLGKKILSKYGAQNGALILNKISKVLSTNPELSALSKSNPAAFKTAVNEMAAKFGESKNSFRSAQDKPTKGPDKWANDGFQKLDSSLQSRIGPKFDDPKIRDLLIQASDLNPGSKAFKNVIKQLEEQI